MANTTFDYRLPRTAALLQNQLRHFRKLLNNRLFGPEPRPVFKEDEYFYSNRELADFMNCSPSTARRYRHKGLIRSSRHGSCVLTHIPTLLDTVAKDDRLAAMFLRRSRPRRATKAPVIRYSCVMKRGWVFVDIRYLGWKGTYVCGVGEVTSVKRLHLIILQIVAARNSYKPFKTLSDEKN
jgi:hypothetical protein